MAIEGWGGVGLPDVNPQSYNKMGCLASSEQDVVLSKRKANLTMPLKVIPEESSYVTSTKSEADPPEESLPCDLSQQKLPVFSNPEQPADATLIVFTSSRRSRARKFRDGSTEL